MGVVYADRSEGDMLIGVRGMYADRSEGYIAVKGICR